jgi:hypothetical protein
MRFMRTVEGVADPIDQLGGGQQPSRLDHAALGVEPHRLDGIEPRALGRQGATDDADAGACLLDPLVVSPDPGPDLGADVPGGVVPDQQQGRLAVGLELGATPGQELGGERADRAAVDEAQPDVLPPAAARRGRPDQQAVAGRRLRVGIVFGDRLLDEVEWPVVGPGVQARGRQPAPPDLVLEAQGPLGVRGRQPEQAIARPFFRAYAGSGLVIQRFARFQPIPSRRIACRIVSSLTRSAVSPSSKLTSAASSSVQTLVGLPKVRGLWCNSARSRSRLASSNAVWRVWGRDDPGDNAARPRALNAWIALRTVCSPHPRCSAIAGTHSPRALASTICARRRVNASLVRSNASTCSRSTPLSSRTKIGGLMPPSGPHSPCPALELH